jgi:uncharacterized protein YecE (DUF72 family)
LDLVHAVDPFLSPSVTPDFVYFCLHGGKGFKHVFTYEELTSLAHLIPAGKPAHVMFNNIAMLEEARRFRLQYFQIG